MTTIAGHGPNIGHGYAKYVIIDGHGNELEPVIFPAVIARAATAAASPRKSVTVSVPTALNTTLRDLATVCGISRETLIGELLDRSLAALAADPEPTSAALTTWPTEPSTVTKSTVHLPRVYNAALAAVAAQSFAGVKSRALQALLGYALERQALPATLPDQHLRISGALYTRLLRHTRAERPGIGGGAPVRSFVEQALEHAITRRKRRYDAEADTLRSLMCADWPSWSKNEEPHTWALLLITEYQLRYTHRSGLSSRPTPTTPLPCASISTGWS